MMLTLLLTLLQTRHRLALITIKIIREAKNTILEGSSLWVSAVRKEVLKRKCEEIQAVGR